VDLGLAGKVVLVTGGGGGTGPTVASAFAAEGAAVAVHYRSSAGRAEDAAGAIRDGGGLAIAVQADLGNRDSTNAAVATVERELGQVGVLVTATSAYRSARLTETSDEDWETVQPHSPTRTSGNACNSGSSDARQSAVNEKPL